MSSNKLGAGEQFPRISLPTISGVEIEISRPYHDATWQLIAIYRGGHSESCTQFLNSLEDAKLTLAESGISIVAASADDAPQLQSHLQQLHVSYPLAYGLSLQQMHELGLFISVPSDFSETNHPFAEPALFVLNEKGQIVIMDITNNELCRPELSRLIHGVKLLHDSETPQTISGSFS
ncbi:redoxin domain-containing protein [Psychrobium sp. 1_MG-2023]|uniref:redoxin domain-containing protein n=1 Tax=Psychrobium sp. 1_MG-2023 TaxID=3062624 RepID=UPI000C33C252|nr:redoxin domain-containing protein [Psychrobium sp. 1_MG-2023]MDP2559544.1 redoxin domain-containing protein [Psychrobium sp. 1_MG-2023]PKF59383.1 thioredoxin peroxidase [Alteromonadales bacterium alter-6D02]